MSVLKALVRICNDSTDAMTLGTNRRAFRRELLPVVNFRVSLVMKSASSFSMTKGEAILKSFFMPITARYGVDKTEKRQPRRKAKHLRLHNVCPLLRHPQNDADLEPHPHLERLLTLMAISATLTVRPTNNRKALGSL